MKLSELFGIILLFIIIFSSLVNVSSFKFKKFLSWIKKFVNSGIWYKHCKNEFKKLFELVLQRPISLYGLLFPPLISLSKFSSSKFLSSSFSFLFSSLSNSILFPSFSSFLSLSSSVSSLINSFLTPSSSSIFSFSSLISSSLTKSFFPPASTISSFTSISSSFFDCFKLIKYPSNNLFSSKKFPEYLFVLTFFSSKYEIISYLKFSRELLSFKNISFVL